MTNPMIRIHNVETNQVIDREMTNDEFAKYQANNVQQENKQIEANAKEAARQTILDRLGITEEEIKLLLS